MKKAKGQEPPQIKIRSHEQLGHAIRRIRKIQKLTQTQLAVKSGLRQATISKIESGNKKAEIGTLFLICAALNLEIAFNTRSQKTNQDFL